MTSTTTDYLDFNVQSETFDLVLTVEGTTGYGQITAISGTADGATATIDTSYEGPDNIVLQSYPFVDADGISFDAGGVAYNLYGPYAPADIISSNNALFNDTVQDLTLAVCYLRGTRIRTPEGEEPVEKLQSGSEILTYGGQRKRVIWVGTGRILVAPRRRNHTAPVIVRRGALGDNVPHSDLHVTAGHCLFVDGILVPAEFLVNHRSILWDDRGQEIEIFHVELEDHDVLVANGAPAESYRDDGNRWMFRNAEPSRAGLAVEACAPVLTGGEQVDAVWARLLARAGGAARAPTTTEADLHVLADGVRIDLEPSANGWFGCTLPKRVGSLAIVSRAAAQDELGRARDPRVLGVALSRIVLWAGDEPRIIDADDMATLAGFHAYEADEGCTWTNGKAILPSASFADADLLQIQVRHTTHYAAPEAESRAA